MVKPSELLAGGPAASEPMVVYTGPKKTGTALIAAVAVDSEKQTTPRRGKKSRVAARKPDAAAEPKADAAKPAVRHASAKPDSAAKPAEKPVAAVDKPAAKPAKPKAVAKPAVKPKSTTSEVKPADQKTTAAPRT
jgi:D-alanyl-D-alanine carboxypeptidase